MVMVKVVPYDLSVDGSNVCPASSSGFLGALPPSLVASDVFPREAKPVG